MTHGASLIAVLVSSVASAHVPPIAGRLVHCIQASEVIFIGVVERVDTVDALTVEVTARVERTLLGKLPGRTVKFRGGARFAPKTRYALFLRRREGALFGVQPGGMYFPSAPADDAQYAQVIAAVRAALAAQEDVRVERLRAALIPALRAGPKELRYNAALELGELAHHGELSAEQRRQLAVIAADSGIDPTLRKMIETAYPIISNPKTPD